MVGVGPKGEESIVARVSLVNQYGKCVYDKYVKPTEPVTDYRTAVSGIRPEKLKQGMAPTVQELWEQHLCSLLCHALVYSGALSCLPGGTVYSRGSSSLYSLCFGVPTHLLKNRIVLELLCAVGSGD